MKASMKKKRGVVGAVVLAGILSVGGYALTNTIAFEETGSAAGFGAQTITAATVTDIDYTLDATDKSSVTAVVFTVDPGLVAGISDAKAYMQHNSGTAWTDCGTITAAATEITCTPAAPIDMKDIGETDAGQTDWAAGAASPAQPVNGTAGGRAPLRLVIAE